MAVYKIARVDLANEVLLKYVVNVLVLVDGKDIPAKGSSQCIVSGITMDCTVSATHQ
jgi:hypothetical protein